MATFSKKMMGKEVGDASVYAQPHDMSGKALKGGLPTETGAQCMTEMNPSVGGISKGNYAPVNPYGVGVMRGYGAATKGHKISGKMG